MTRSGVTIGSVRGSSVPFFGCWAALRAADNETKAGDRVCYFTLLPAFYVFREGGVLTPGVCR